MKEPPSNTEWIAWGNYDPLYAVSSYAEHDKNGSEPWTEENFYAFGADVWTHLRDVWESYGMSRGVCVEIGCGAGRITRQLALEFSNVHAFDVSSEMLAIARRNIPSKKVTFHLTNGQEIDLPDASVSAAFSTDVFQHFSNASIAERYFSELSRVLAADSTIMIHLPIYNWPSHDRVFASLYAIIQKFQSMQNGLKRFAIKLGIMDPFMDALRYELPWLFECLDKYEFGKTELRLISLPISRKRINPKPYLLATRIGANDLEEAETHNTLSADECLRVRKRE